MFLQLVKEIENVLKTAQNRIRRGFPARILEKRLDEVFHQLILALNDEFEQLTDPNVIRNKVGEYLRALERLQAQYDESSGLVFWSKILTVMTILRAKFWRYAFEETETQRHLVELLSYALTKAEIEKGLEISDDFKTFREFSSNYRFIITLGLEYWILMDDMYLVDNNAYLEWCEKCLRSFDTLIHYSQKFLDKMTTDSDFFAEIDQDTLKNNLISFLSVYLQIYIIDLTLLRRSLNQQVLIPAPIDMFDRTTSFTITEFLDQMDKWTHVTVDFMSSFISALEEHHPYVYHGLVQQGAFQSPHFLFFHDILSVQQVQTNHYRMLDVLFSMARVSPLESSFSCKDRVLFENLGLLATELEQRLSKDLPDLQDPNNLAARPEKIMELTVLVENLSCQLLYFPDLINPASLVEKLKQYTTILCRLPLGTFSFQELYGGIMALLAHGVKSGRQGDTLHDFALNKLESLRKSLKIRVPDRITVEILVQLLQGYHSGKMPLVTVDELLLKRLPSSYLNEVLEYINYCNESAANPRVSLPSLLRARSHHFSIADPLTWIIIEFPFKTEDERTIMKLRFIPFNFYIDRNLGLNP